MIVDKEKAVAALQTLSPDFPMGVYNSPILYLGRLFTNLVIPMIYLAALIWIVGRLRKTGIDLANGNCVSRLKLCCVLCGSILVSVPTAATYIAWNDPQVPDWFMAKLFTMAAICDVLRLPLALGFVFIGYRMMIGVSASWPARATRATLRALGFHRAAARLEHVPRTKFIATPSRAADYEDGGLLSIPSVAIPALFWIFLLSLTIMIARAYRIS